MSETTGWKRGGKYCDYQKEINGHIYEINKGHLGLWHIWNRGINIGRELTLADAKRAAHDHARARG